MQATSNNILIAGNNADCDFWECAKCLSSYQYDNFTVSSLDELRKHVQNGKHRILILSTSIVNCQNINLLKKLKESFQNQIIIAGSYHNKTDEVCLRRTGIHCFILLPDEAEMLRQAVESIQKQLQKRYIGLEPLNIKEKNMEEEPDSKLNDINQDIEELHDEDEDTIDNMFLTFVLGGEVYGIGIAHVTEIVGIQKITEVPDMPNFVKGVVNLRGQVIPVIDVRLRFSMPPREYDERTCIVVVDIKGILLGLVVDTVSEVMTIDNENISPPPKVATANSAQYIKGMGKVGEQVKILLDGQKLLFEEEVAALA